MEDAAAVADALDDRPELEAPLRDVLAVDDGADEWTFDDVPVDSGAFGELVSRGFVEKTDDGDAYRVANPDAVAAALDGDSDSAASGSAGSSPAESSATPELPDSPDLGSLRQRLIGFDRTTVGSLLGALVVVVLARAYVYGSVFRDGAVVLSGNDPYYYRYWVEQVLAASGGVLDFSSLSAMPDAVLTGEPLLVATLWAVTSLLGGDAAAAGWVLAWYPVVAAVITAYLVYRLAMVVTSDRRVALAALVLLAVTPAHAFRTSLGFADHHAFDYVWLMITAYALVRLTGYGDVDWRERGQWAWAGVLGLGIAGQILAWDAGPLLIVPLGIYVAVRVLGDVRDGRAPVPANLPLLGGVALGTLLVYVVHAQFGWHSDTVAFSPVLLTLGTLGVLGAGELAHRFDVSVRALAGIEVVGGLVGLFALRTLRPDYWAELMAGVGRITAGSDIAEMQSLLSGDTFGWLLLFGFVLALAVPFLVWESIEAYHGKRRWLVPVVYGWYFLLLGVYQVRFAGQLAMFASVFAVLGFVYLAAAVDLTEMPVQFVEDRDLRPSVAMPSRRTAGRFALLFLLVAGLSVVQVPVKTSQVVTDGEQYQTAAWMNDYAAEQEWAYPRNYVFSHWPENRMYNYFVNGEARSYAYAERYYSSFLGTTNVTDWADRLESRSGFVVTDDQFDLGQGTIYSYLHEHYGGADATLESQGRFRAIYESPDGSQKVFTPVQGALVAGQTSANGSGTVSTQVSLPESTFTYEREVAVAENGWYMVRVPYPATYDLPGDRSVSVTESNVAQGSIANERHSNATWSLNASQGQYVFDQTGGNHGRLIGGTWHEGEGWSGVSFNRNGYVEIPDGESIDGTEGFAVSVRFKLNESVEYQEDLRFPRIVSKAPASAYRDTDGYQIVLSGGRLVGIVGNGSSATKVYGGQVPVDSWNNATLTWDGSTLRFFVNGNLVDTGSFAGSPENDSPLVFGASSDGAAHFAGSIDGVKFRNHSEG